MKGALRVAWWELIMFGLRIAWRIRAFVHPAIYKHEFVRNMEGQCAICLESS